MRAACHLRAPMASNAALGLPSPMQRLAVAASSCRRSGVAGLMTPAPASWPHPTWLDNAQMHLLPLFLAAWVPASQARQRGSGGAGGSSTRTGSSSLVVSAMPFAQLASDAAEIIYAPTGVPLVDELLKLSSVGAAAWHSMRLLAFLGALAVLGTLLLRALDHAAGRRIRNDTSGIGSFNVAGSVLASAFQPCQVMLPLYCATRAATVVLALAEVAATKCGVDPAALLSCCIDRQLLGAMRWLSLAAGGDSRQVQLMAGMKWATQLMQDCSELVLIVGAAWAILEFKGRVMNWAVNRLTSDADPHNDGAVPLLRLFSATLTIAVLMVACAITLAGFGFHIGPLMASVGGLGVVIGLATQDLLSNIAAAVSLYSTRPFVTNDRVDLVNPEGVEVSGIVLNIEPTRTILRDDKNGCIVHISNNGISNYIIKNYTQSRNLSRLQELHGEGPRVHGHTMQELMLAMRTGDGDEDLSGASDSATHSG